MIITVHICPQHKQVLYIIMLIMKSSQHVPWMQVALAACALPIKQPRQLKVKHVRPDLELMILMRQGFRCRESKWWGWVKQQLKLVHVADSWDMMNYACSFTSEQPKTVHLSKTSLLHESSALHSLSANWDSVFLILGTGLTLSLHSIGWDIWPW